MQTKLNAYLSHRLIKTNPSLRIFSYEEDLKDGLFRKREDRNTHLEILGLQRKY